MSNESDAIKPSHIAAAKLKLAIATRKGEEVPAWIRELASRSLSDSMAGYQGPTNEPEVPAPLSQPRQAPHQGQGNIEEDTRTWLHATRFGAGATLGRIQAQKDLIRAVAHHQAAGSNGMNGAFALIGRGLQLQAQGDMAGAELAYHQAIDSGHSDAMPMAAVGLGILLEGEGDVAGAKAAYQQAIDSGHADAAPTAGIRLGILLEREEDIAGAKAAYQQAIDSGHADAAPTAAVGLGILLASQGDVAGAERAYQQAIDSGHADAAPTAAVGLGILLASQGDAGRARAAFQLAIDAGDADLGMTARHFLSKLE
jgi:tetratricopeptide (TPR) repeat protein